MPIVMTPADPRGDLCSGRRHDKPLCPLVKLVLHTAELKSSVFYKMSYMLVLETHGELLGQGSTVGGEACAGLENPLARTSIRFSQNAGAGFLHRAEPPQRGAVVWAGGMKFRDVLNNDHLLLVACHDCGGKTPLDPAPIALRVGVQADIAEVTPESALPGLRLGRHHARRAFAGRIARNASRSSRNRLPSGRACARDSAVLSLADKNTGRCAMADLLEIEAGRRRHPHDEPARGAQCAVAADARRAAGSAAAACL